MSKIQTNKIQHTANGAAEFTLPTADGTSGQFLRTNASGVLSFATATDTLPDYVKIASASGSSGGSSIDISSLDVSTYKAFEIFLTLQPTNDNVNFYARLCSLERTDVSN